MRFGSKCLDILLVPVQFLEKLQISYNDEKEFFRSFPEDLSSGKWKIFGAEEHYRKITRMNIDE